MTCAKRLLVNPNLETYTAHVEGVWTRGPIAAVIQFPGTNGDRDMAESFTRAGFTSVMVDSREHVPRDAPCRWRPRRFCLRRLLARRYARALRPRRAWTCPTSSARGGLVIGICNGFQILVEAGLCPAP